MPRGRTLPPSAWLARHRGLLVLLGLHVLALPVFGVANGWSTAAALASVAPAAAFGGLALIPRQGRTLRAAWCALGLLSCSAALVVLWHGTIEAHFHYFVMVAALSLYEELSVYALAVGFVVLQHGLMGELGDDAVFSHPMDAAQHSMWFWAVVHGVFIAALSLFELVSWGANERVRAGATRDRDETATSEARLRATFTHAPISMAVTTADGRITRLNEAMVERFGSREDLLGAPLWTILADDERERARREWPLAEDREHEVRTIDRDGRSTWTLWSHVSLPGEDGEMLFQGVDVTARRSAEAKLAEQAWHDPLTGLANRARFGAVLQEAVDGLPTTAGGVGVLFVDLDDFKLVNDSLGHSIGDEMLVAVADRLRTGVRGEDLLARFGGDEFVICANDVTLADLEAMADRLAGVLSTPIELAGQLRFVTASIGIALQDSASDDPAEALASNADAAMYRAKAEGKARRMTFDDTLRSRAAHRLDTENALRLALERDELELDYQPLVNLADERISGVEALVRWRRPGVGRIPPLEFIPLAEQTGLVVPIGRWVLQEACREVQRLRMRPDGDHLVVGVNLSAVQLGDAGLLTDVGDALHDSGLPASHLCLEVTESAVMRDPEAGRAMLRELQSLGVHIAIDDFGVGQSSLSHLQWLMPVGFLKLDRSFVDGVDANPQSRAVVQSVLDLAGALDMDVVVEGVETRAQSRTLREMGADLGQGFHYARPMPARELRTLDLRTPADRSSSLSR